MSPESSKLYLCLITCVFMVWGHKRQKRKIDLNDHLLEAAGPLAHRFDIKSH